MDGPSPKPAVVNQDSMKLFLKGISAIVFFLPLMLGAQSEVDVIQLKNGSTFEGKILEYQQGSLLRFQLRSGGVIELKESEVSQINQGWEVEEGKVEKEEESPVLSKVKAYAFKEKGVFNATYFSTLSGTSEGDFQMGLGIHNITGYQFHRLIGLGGGFGVDTYSFDNGETLYPIFFELRGYLSAKKMAPYYSGSVGYGLAFKDSDELINKAEGGIFYRLALGLRLGADEDTNVLADIGYQFQEAFFERRTVFLNEIEEKLLKFKRIVVRVGLIF